MLDSEFKETIRERYEALVNQIVAITRPVSHQKKRAFAALPTERKTATTTTVDLIPKRMVPFR